MANEAIYNEERKRLELEASHRQAVEEIIKSVPENEPNREQIIAAIQEATLRRADAPIVSRFFSKGAQGYKAGLQVDISRRGFFNDPEITERYGVGVLNRARDIIKEFSAQKAGIKE